jgi:hypothetical protein
MQTKFLSIEEVGTEEIRVCEVVNKLSFVGGQGFIKCNCSKKCTTKRINKEIRIVTSYCLIINTY